MINYLGLLGRHLSKKKPRIQQKPIIITDNGVISIKYLKSEIEWRALKLAKCIIN